MHTTTTYNIWLHIACTNPWVSFIAWQYENWFWCETLYKLPALGGNRDDITISGYSAGSYTAANMHTVFSDRIKGVGLIAGGCYSDFVWPW